MFKHNTLTGILHMFVLAHDPLVAFNRFKQSNINLSSGGRVRSPLPLGSGVRNRSIPKARSDSCKKRGNKRLLNRSQDPRHGCRAIPSLPSNSTTPNHSQAAGLCWQTSWRRQGGDRLGEVVDPCVFVSYEPWFKRVERLSATGTLLKAGKSHCHDD